MARFRMYPTGKQEQQMLLHCAHARYVWNLAVEQHAHWKPGRKPTPGFAEQCRQLTEQRRHQRSNQRRGRTGRDSPPPANSRCRRDDSAHAVEERP